MSGSTITMKKANKKTRIGIKFQKRDDGSLYVSFIRPGGLCSMSDLELNDEILSVNGIVCKDKSPGDIIKMIRKTKGEISFIVAPKTVENKEEKSAPVRKFLHEDIDIYVEGDDSSPSFECQLSL